MEENTARVDEIEEVEPEDEIEEVPESSGSGAFVAGIVGGFLAYAVIGGAKKLIAFAQTKLAGRKRKEGAETVVDADFVEVPDEKQEEAEAAPEEK